MHRNDLQRPLPIAPERTSSRRSTAFLPSNMPPVFSPSSSFASTPLLSLIPVENMPFLFPNRSHLLEEEIREVKTEELKRTLETIATHVESMIEAAEKRAEVDEPPSPGTWNGAGATGQGVSNGPSRTCSESQHDSSMLSVLCDTIESGRSQSVPVAKIPTATWEPARSRVLGRANSVRRLFLGPTREDGDRLEHFAHQMGLPHSIVVKHVQVMYEQPIAKIPGLRRRGAVQHGRLFARSILSIAIETSLSVLREEGSSFAREHQWHSSLVRGRDVIGASFPDHPSWNSPRSLLERDEKDIELFHVFRLLMTAALLSRCPLSSGVRQQSGAGSNFAVGVTEAKEQSGLPNGILPVVSYLCLEGRRQATLSLLKQRVPYKGICTALD